MPATMEWWKTPMLDLLENTQAVEGKDKTPTQADQQGNAISKPDFRIDFGFEDMDGHKGTPHDGQFDKEISAHHVTDGMKKAGY